MKKIESLIAAVILLSLCAVPALAAEYSVPAEQEISVFAKAVYTLPDGCYDAENRDGDYEVTLPDGTQITVTPDNGDTALRLVIYPITQKDGQAYQWFLKHTTSLGTDLRFYDIYFIDHLGARVEVNMAAAVHITLPQGYGVPKAFALTSGGAATKLDSKVRDNVLSFTIERGGYYVIAAAPASSPLTPSQPGYAGTVASVSPQTGDSSNLYPWTVLLLISGLCIAVTILWVKKRKIDDKS